MIWKLSDQTQYMGPTLRFLPYARLFVHLSLCPASLIQKRGFITRMHVPFHTDRRPVCALAIQTD